MASSISNPKTKHHTRSISLPSRPHHVSPQLDEHLCRLRSSEGASSSSLPSISCKLSGLKDLYDCVDDLLLLPQTQKVFSQECNGNRVNEALDGTLRVLEVCGTAKDILLETKDIVQELQSILRRKRGSELRLVDEVGVYLVSRKKAKKVISKSLRDLKTKSTFSPSNNGTMDTVTSHLSEAGGVTLNVSLIYRTKVQPKTSRWCLLSKLMHTKRVASEEEATKTNEFEKVDAALCSFISHKTYKSSPISAEKLQSALGKLESSVQDLEEGLECLLRRLIKTRGTLLNILNN